MSEQLDFDLWESELSEYIRPSRSQELLAVLGAVAASALMGALVVVGVDIMLPADQNGSQYFTAAMIGSAVGGTASLANLARNRIAD